MKETFPHAPADRLASELLPGELYHTLRSHFTRRDVEYIAHVLCEAEIRVIRDLSDALYIARIKRMKPARLRRYDQFVPRDAQQTRQYEQAQLKWLADEEYLLGLRLHHKPTQRELIQDFNANQNGLRFRAYYTMKHRAFMKPIRSACFAS